MSGPGSYLCCSVRIDGYGPDAAVAALLESRYGQARGAHLCNSYTLALALRDPAYREVLNSGDLNFADGHYVAMVGRWRGQKDLTERVYGPDLMKRTMDRGRERGLRHYLYGAKPKTVERLAEVLRERYPGVQIVGVESPPFRPLTEQEEAELAARVAEARPDILWVGTGTPPGRVRGPLHEHARLHRRAGRRGLRLPLGQQAGRAAVDPARRLRVAVPLRHGTAAARATLRGRGPHVRRTLARPGYRPPQVPDRLSRGPSGRVATRAGSKGWRPAALLARRRPRNRHAEPRRHFARSRPIERQSAATSDSTREGWERRSVKYGTAG